MYGFLQEVLHFSFYHPKEMFVPDALNFPDKAAWTFAASARFTKRGFHIHSQHPLELTPFLLDYKTGAVNSKYKLQIQEYQDAVEDLVYKVLKKALVYR